MCHSFTLTIYQSTPYPSISLHILSSYYLSSLLSHSSRIIISLIIYLFHSFLLPFIRAHRILPALPICFPLSIIISVLSPVSSLSYHHHHQAHYSWLHSFAVTTHHSTHVSPYPSLPPLSSLFSPFPASSDSLFTASLLCCRHLSKHTKSFHSFSLHLVYSRDSQLSSLPRPKPRRM